MRSYNGFTSAQRNRAYAWLKRQGLPVITECQVCGQTEGKLMPHSEDYSEPYGPHIGAFHLCFLCHMMVHCRFRNPRAWNHYREAIRRGMCFPPVPHFGQVVADFLNRSRAEWPVPFQVRDEVPSTWLDTLEVPTDPQTSFFDS